MKIGGNHLENILETVLLGLGLVTETTAAGGYCQSGGRCNFSGEEKLQYKQCWHGKWMDEKFLNINVWLTLSKRSCF